MTTREMAAAAMILATQLPALAAVIQVEEDGFIISYPEAGFATATGGVIEGQVPAYGDDAGFFYNPVTDRYVQVEEDGFIISYTAAGFLTGNGGIIEGQVPAYGDDAGFLFVAEYPRSEVPAAATLALLLGGIGIMAALRRRRPCMNS